MMCLAGLILHTGIFWSHILHECRVPASTQACHREVLMEERCMWGGAPLHSKHDDKQQPHVRAYESLTAHTQIYGKQLVEMGVLHCTFRFSCTGNIVICVMGIYHLLILDGCPKKEGKHPGQNLSPNNHLALT